MPEPSIRIASQRDAQTLSHIGVATFVESYSDIIDGAAMMAHCTREHSKATYTTYLAAADTKAWLAEAPNTHAPIGYALNCKPDLPILLHSRDLELKRIYVLSKFHGSGIAACLVEAAIDHARQSNAPRLLLGTYEGNHRALAFYKKYGFAQIGTRQFQVGDNIYDDIVMAKQL